jgi:glutamate--cysteine ligase
MAVEVSDSTPVENRDQLVAYMERGCKPKDQWRIGTEHEKFVVRCADHKPAPYQPAGIAALLEQLQQELQWDRIVQDGNLIGLADPITGAAISLEPGGQFELSGAPLQTLHETSDEIDAHYKASCAAAKALGLSFLGLGFWPAGPRSDMPRMPKRRYEIMTSYMPKVGSLGLDMMYRTCTVQVNLDFSTEAEMAKMMRIGMALQPVASALFAASPFSEGEPNGFQTIRPHIWRHTDNDRAGILPFVFNTEMSFGRYVEWALDVPMYFVKRGEIYHDVAGVPFHALLEGKVPQLPGERATMADWINHLGTLFPEVRLKHFVEMRGADSGPRAHIKALPALWTGLLYDEPAREAAFDLIKSWSYENVQNLYENVPHQGFSARINGRLVLEVARDIVTLADKGLKARGQKNTQAYDETIFLDVLKKRAVSGKTYSDELLEKFSGPWREDIAPIFECCAL